MKNTFLFLSLYLFIACSNSQQKPNNLESDHTIKDNFKQVFLEREAMITDKGSTFSPYELRFDGVNSKFLTHQLMFDNFGIWDEEFFSPNDEHPVLLWKKINLLSSSNNFTIMTDGNENKYSIYSSIKVLDENQKDMLDDSSPQKQKIIKHLENLFRNIDSEKKVFYDVYWKMINTRSNNK